MMKNSNLGIAVVIILLLFGCNFASTRYEYKVDCVQPGVFEFKLRGSFIKHKITGYLEEDAEVYVQSYEENYPRTWDVVYLKKGIVNYESSFETYAPKGRIIYIPVGNRSTHSLSKKEKLVVQIQTAYD